MQGYDMSFILSLNCDHVSSILSLLVYLSIYRLELSVYRSFIISISNMKWIRFYLYDDKWLLSSNDSSCGIVHVVDMKITRWRVWGSAISIHSSRGFIVDDQRGICLINILEHYYNSVTTISIIEFFVYILMYLWLRLYGIEIILCDL